MTRPNDAPVDLTPWRTVRNWVRDAHPEWNAYWYSEFADYYVQLPTPAPPYAVAVQVWLDLEVDE